MTSTQLFVISLVALVLGVVVLVFGKESHQPWAGMLITAGLGSLAGAKVVAGKERETKQERARAESAERELSQTQTALRRMETTVSPAATKGQPPTA